MSNDKKPGEFIPEGVFIVAAGTREDSKEVFTKVESSRFLHVSMNMDPFEGFQMEVIKHIKAGEIVPGDQVLMEYAKGIVETVKVLEIVDGIVYGEGEDGEPLCAPIANCDLVPYR